MNPQSSCMDEGICTKGFFKKFCRVTIINKKEYLQYMKRCNNTVRHKKHVLSNAFFVPYNKYLLSRFYCHINVKGCPSIKSIKYIFKHIYKDYDCAGVELTNKNEHSQFINSRYVSAPGGMWRLLENKMSDKSHD
ncbi:hypothetical protein NCER_101731 [Vairimorpha ceranae BRL01]|uniref:Uncharacterized protein n=2 Tax=Vairimorpha ceranae TaxID=40302 RepID=C4VAN0_VAIC1|nr:hypothetical protein NCER_101731 [Vairimorpha ceranae BRL01]